MVTHLTTPVKHVDKHSLLCYSSVMKDTIYKVSEAARLLGLDSRQALHYRRQVEGWEGCVKNGGLYLIPGSAIQKSRDLERDNLLERVNELKELEIEQMLLER